MAFVGLSLILASVVYIAIRRPPLFQTLIAFLRHDPQIEQPSRTGSPRPNTPETNGSQTQASANLTNQDEPNVAPSISAPAPAKTQVDLTPPPPPPNLTMSTPSKKEGDLSPQTTPKASAAQSNRTVPSFSLSDPDHPASAAVVARSPTRAKAPSPTMPSPSTATPSPSILMQPPPRPPKLNNINNSNLLSPAPMRNGPLPNRGQQTRQPGTSTLAPPPTHSAKPAKPSRAVVLKPGHSPLDWARLANSPTSDLRNLPPGTSYLKVTPSMLKKQTGRKGKDAWTALGGRVYNITPYLPFHPGGEPELLRSAGRDGTKLFGEIHPWVNYEGMLASSLIGLLVEEHEAQENGMDAMD